MPLPAYAWQRCGDDFELVDCNDAAEAITSGAISDFVGLAAAEMYPDRPDVVEDISRCFAEKASFQREMDYTFKTSGEDKRLVVQYAYAPPDMVLVQTEDITELHEALKEASYERDLMQTILEHAPDYVYFKDRDRKFVQASNSFTELFNLDLSEIIGKRDEDLFPPEIAEETASDDRRVIETGTPLIDKEEGGESIGGEAHYVLTSKLPWYDKDGDIIGLFGVSREITDRRRAEDVLRYQATLLSNVTDSVIETDLDFVIQSWNGAAEALYGWSAEEAIGKSMVELVPARYPVEQPEAVLAEFQSKGFWRGEVIQKRKDGSDVWADASVTTVRDEADNPICVLAINRDITAHRLAEVKLRESEANYREMVENINDVIYTIDMEGVVTYVSPAIEPFLGLPPEKLIGRPFVQYVLPEDLDRVTNNVKEILSGDSPGPNEYRVMRPSGEIRWIRTSSLPIVSDDRITGLQGVMTDITAAKRAEEKLEEAATAAERQRLARELHDSVTQTLYGIDLYSNATDEALSAGKIDTVSENIRHIQDLSHSALADMRLLIFELRPPLLVEEGLAQALRERLDLVEARAGFNTTLRVTSEDPIRQTIENELYAVATEALNNTLKHAHAENVTVILEFEDYVIRLSIHDDRVGFAPEARERSEGFGFTNMRERAERLGGSLFVESSLGEGATIRVEVPA